MSKHGLKILVSVVRFRPKPPVKPARVKETPRSNGSRGFLLSALCSHWYMVCARSSSYARSDEHPSRPFGPRTYASKPGLSHRFDPVWRRWMDSISSRSKNLGRNADLGRLGADAVSLCGFRDLDALGSWGGAVWMGVLQVVGIAWSCCRARIQIQIPERNLPVKMNSL